MELLAAGNPSVVRVHPRQCPAVAVQGGTRYTWFHEVEQVVRGEASVEEPAPERSPWRAPRSYELVLSDQGLALPYVRRAYLPEWASPIAGCRAPDTCRSGRRDPAEALATGAARDFPIAGG